MQCSPLSGRAKLPNMSIYVKHPADYYLDDRNQRFLMGGFQGRWPLSCRPETRHVGTTSRLLGQNFLLFGGVSLKETQSGSRLGLHMPQATHLSKMKSRHREPGETFHGSPAFSLTDLASEMQQSLGQARSGCPRSSPMGTPGATARP